MEHKHIFSEGYQKRKTAVLSALKREAKLSRQARAFPLSLRLTAVIAVAAVLSVGVFAAVRLIDFRMELDDDTAKIHAELHESTDASTTPNRAWNANEDEVMVRLSFGYMPEDIEPDLTANGKYGGAESSRAMTFSGFDLRICDLNTVIGNVGKAEEFTAGGNRAFLITSDSELALYTKTLYVLFEEDELIIKASVGFGISEEELKAIAAGLGIEETDDISLALPIANETGLGGTSDIPFIYISESPKAYREDLLALGESGHYDFLSSYDDITVEKAELFDSIASLNQEYLTNSGRELLRSMTDAEGSFIPYKRTMVDNEAGKFGETTEVTKRLVVFTVKLKEVWEVDDVEPNPLAFMQTFKLGRLVTNEDGTIERNYAIGTAVIDRTPGTNAGTAEAIYREPLGDDTYRIAYLIDDDQLDSELLLDSRYAEIYYVIPVDSLVD